MKILRINFIIFTLIPLYLISLPLFFWEPDDGRQNFGDYISKILIERIVNHEVRKADINEKKILAIGSILHFAKDGDLVWGSGINGKHPFQKDYSFKSLNIRSVRGPLTRKMLQSFGLEVPEIYGDPALLFSAFFPEFKVNPIREYLVIVHISEEYLFPKNDNIVYATDPWNEIIQKIVESKFVISTSLHGLIIAESFGIPARLLRITAKEPLFKYSDYYLGTGRENFQYAKTIKQALQMGGEKPPICDLNQLLKVFPYEYF
jgi:pyruvyltransferase